MPCLCLVEVQVHHLLHACIMLMCSTNHQYCGSSGASTNVALLVVFCRSRVLITSRDREAAEWLVGAGVEVQPWEVGYLKKEDAAKLLCTAMDSFYRGCATTGSRPAACSCKGRPCGREAPHTDCSTKEGDALSRATTANFAIGYAL